MDVLGIAALATGLATASTDQAVSIAVLKKVLDSESQVAAGLINALPPVPAANLPAYLGQNVNTIA